MVRYRPGLAAGRTRILELGSGRTFEVLVGSAGRARDAGRFSATCDPQQLATQFWVTGHGLVMVVLTGVLPPEVLDLHAPPSPL